MEGLFSMIRWLQILYTLIVKDLGIEIKSKEIFITIIPFAILVVTTFAVTSNSTSQIPEDIGAAIIWTSVLFSGSLAMIKFFSSEFDNQTMSGIILMPVPKELIFFGKSISFFIFLTISELVIFGAFSILFNSNAFSWLILLGALIFNFGFSFIGTFFGTIAARSNSRESLLALLVIPLLIPIIMFVVEITKASLSGFSPPNLSTWLGISICYDIIFLVILTFLFGKILEE